MIEFRTSRQATPACESFMHLHLGIDAQGLRSNLACHPIVALIIKPEKRHKKNMLALPKLHNLPNSFPVEGAVRIELVEGIPLFRASITVQERINTLLEKQQKLPLNTEEEQELDLYEEIDDYLSFINRTVRNLYLTQNQSNL